MKAQELARQLAKTLAEGEEYQNYHKAKAKLEEHEAAKMMLEDFRKKEWELEQKKQHGAPNLKADEEELKKLASAISFNPYIRDYLTAEYLFFQIFMEVQRIIGEGVGLNVPEYAIPSEAGEIKPWKK